jgi:hypothetical protein
VANSLSAFIRVNPRLKKTRPTNEILFCNLKREPRCGQHHFLASHRLVLFAFFVTATVAASTWIELSALSLAILAALPVARLAASRTIILRITAGGVLATTLPTTLFHALVSFSVVCHISPPFFRSMRIFRPSTNGRPLDGFINHHAKKKNQRNRASRRSDKTMVSIQTVQSA